MEDNSSAKKSFWQTLPGILTALAAIVTAITGLLLAFNQMGWFNKNSKEPQTANTTSLQNSTTADTSKTNSSIVNKPAGKITGVTFSMIDIKGKDGDHEYKILESVIEPKDPSSSILKIKMRYTNTIAYPANFWSSGFRLSVDDVLHEPSVLVDEIVAGHSSKEAIIPFEFPNDAKKLELIIFDSDEKIVIPVTITKN